MKNIIIVASCALIFSYLTSASEENSKMKSWREVVAGNQSNIQQITRQVIRNQEQWVKWWDEHNPVEILVEGRTVVEPPPKVDFTVETVLVATMGRHSSGGFSIRFTGIHREGEVVTATLNTTFPGVDDIVTNVMTAPFCVIAIPKHEGRVEFVGEN